MPYEYKTDMLQAAQCDSSGNFVANTGSCKSYCQRMDQLLNEYAVKGWECFHIASINLSVKEDGLHNELPFMTFFFRRGV